MGSSTTTNIRQLLIINASSSSLLPHHDKSAPHIGFTPTSQYSFVHNDGNNSTIYNQSTWLLSAASTVITTFHNTSDMNANSEQYELPQPHRPERHLGWTNLILALGLCVLIVITVIGNTLVILSVLTTRRLRTVTNCFVMSLAVADWLVGIFVMPPAVALYLIGM